ENFRSRGVAEERALSTLLQLDNDIDVSFQDERIDSEFSQETSDALTGGAIADDNGAGIFLFPPGGSSICPGTEFLATGGEPGQSRESRLERERPTKNKGVQAYRDDGRANHNVAPVLGHEAERFPHSRDDKRKLSDLRQS